MFIQFFIKLVPSKKIFTQTFLVLALLWSAAACKEEKLNVHDPVQQAADDDALIREWMARDSTMRQAKRTDSGIYYATQKAGTGAQVKFGNTVKVHYIGRFLNGSKFDSSYDNGQDFPVTIGQTAVIKGWTEGLQLLHEGETARLYIPSGLAYGPYGNRSIPANTVLVFDINVLRIVN